MLAGLVLLRSASRTRRQWEASSLRSEVCTQFTTYGVSRVPLTLKQDVCVRVQLTRVSVCVLPAYKDLQSREDIRNAAWQREGWDEVVYYTGKFGFSVLTLLS